MTKLLPMQTFASFVATSKLIIIKWHHLTKLCSALCYTYTHIGKLYNLYILFVFLPPRTLKKLPVSLALIKFHHAFLSNYPNVHCLYSNLWMDGTYEQQKTALKEIDRNQKRNWSDWAKENAWCRVSNLVWSEIVQQWI